MSNRACPPRIPPRHGPLKPRQRRPTPAKTHGIPCRRPSTAVPFLAASGRPFLPFRASGRAARAGPTRVRPEIHKGFPTMSGTYLVRAVGVLTCLAVVGTGWDAEAGWRRHHHRRAACCAPVCCEPVCCEPVYETVCCEPVRETVCCEPVRETVCCEPVRAAACCETVIVVPASTCCTNRVVVEEKTATSRQTLVMKTESAQPTIATEGTTATTVSLKR